MNLTGDNKRVFWAFGVIERLAHLGYLHGVPHNIKPEQIDYFLEIDNDRLNLFESDEQFDDLFSFICDYCKIFDDDKVSIVKHLAKDYMTNRDELVRFAYQNNPNLKFI